MISTGSLLLELVPFAVGLLVTPAAIAAGILFLASRRPVPNASAFAAAFVLVYAVISAVVLAASGTRTGPLISTATKGVVGIVVGVVLLVAAVASLVTCGAPSARRPRWMAEIEDAGPRRAFGIGIVLSLVNPNVAILLGGLAAIAATGLPLLDQVAGAVLLLVAATIALVGPVVAYVVAAERVTGVLRVSRQWLIRHQRSVNIVVFVVFGGLFLVRGLADVG